MLAIELGGREAARRLGIKESTVLSWAKRCDWKLPKRKGGAISAIKLHSKPGDALIAAHEELEGATKTALMQTLAKAAQQVAGKEALDISNTAQLRDICLAAARIFGWDGKPQTEVTITNQAGVVCDEATRARLIKLREEIQAERPTPVTPPEPCTKLQANVCAGNRIPAAAQELIEKPGPAFSAPVGAIAPSDSSPTYRAWLEHEKAEPEPGSEYEI
jgi:hypothetical protein